jgi:hypothetical protein
MFAAGATGSPGRQAPPMLMVKKKVYISKHAIVADLRPMRPYGRFKTINKHTHAHRLFSSLFSRSASIFVYTDEVVYSLRVD